MALPAFLSNPAFLAGGAALLGGGLGMMGGGGQGWQRRHGKQQARNLRNASNEVAGNWFQPFTGQRFAPTQPGYERLFAGAGSYDPWSMINRGAGILANNVGGDTFDATMINPDAWAVTPESVTATNPDQINAMTSQFINPYIDQVLNRTRAGAERNLASRRAADAGRMAGLGAFGSSGQALTDAMTTEGFARVLADTEAQLRDRGFRSARDAALGRAGAMDQIATGNANRLLAAGQGNQSAAMTAARANQAARENAARINQSGRGMDIDIGRLLMGGGAGMIPQLMQLAQTEQGIAQQQPDFDFSEFLRRQNFDINKLAALSGGNPLMNFAAGQQSNPWLRGLSSGIGFGSQVYDFLRPRPDADRGAVMG